MKPHRVHIIGALALCFAGPVAAQQTPDLAPYLMDDRAAEVALARTAAPRSISDSATVLVLTRTGYVQAARGTNGFTCAVERSFLGPIGAPDSWNPRVRAPHCFNPPAVRTMLPVMEARTSWVMAGVSEAEMGARLRRMYAQHGFAMPAVGAMAYMMSREQHLQDADPQNWMPHVMFYFPVAMPGVMWGADVPGGPVIDVSGTDRYSPVRTLAIPVRQWSDGTAAPSAGHQE